MQLILTQPTTEDINIKMSTQTESPVNGNISEIKEINQAFQIDEDTIAALEKSLSNELPASEISKDIVLEEQKSLDNDTIGNINCISEDIIKDASLIKNINGIIVPENITNGTDCAQESKDSECKSQDVEMIKNDEPVQEPCLTNNVSKNIDRVTELKETTELTKENMDESLCTVNKAFLEDTGDTAVSVNTTAPLNCQESGTIKADAYTVDEKIENSPEVIKDASGSDTENLDDETKVVEVPAIETEYSDDVIMDEENKKQSDEPVDVKINNESNTLLDAEVEDLALVDDDDVSMHEVDEISTENAILPVNKDPKPIEIDEEVQEPVETGINVISPEAEPVKIDEDMLQLETNENVILTEAKDSPPVKMDRAELLTLKAGDNGTSVIENDPKSFVMDEEELQSLKTAENVLPTVIEDSKPMETDEEVLLPVQTCENVILPQANDSKLIEMSKENMPPDLEESNSDQCTENEDDRKETHNTATDNVKQLRNNASDINLGNIQDTDALLLDSTKTCVDNKVLDDEKNIDNGSMEIDDVETIKLDNKNLQQISSTTSNISSNEVVSKDTIVVDTTEPEATSASDQKVAESVIIRRDSDSNEVKDNIESDSSLKIILEKKDIENSLETKNQDNSNILVATAESKIVSNNSTEKDVTTKEDQENIEIIDEDDVKIVDLDEETTKPESEKKENSPERQETIPLPVVCKLSNTLDILSDDEEEASNVAKDTPLKTPEEKQCIDIDDDDDIMLIEEEDSSSKSKPEVVNSKEEPEPKLNTKIDNETEEKQTTDITDMIVPNINEKDTSLDNISGMDQDAVPEPENKSEGDDKTIETKKPLLPQNFLKTAKKNLAGMTRHELEDFCILRIVESIVDRSNLSDIKTKIKTMAQNLEDYKKRVTMMTKQNRDLQVVLKSVQEEQKRRTNAPIQPLKITRSVGMQVLMNDKLDPRRKAPIPNPVQNLAGPSGRPLRGVQSAKQIKPPATPPSIPVPRKVPVINSPAKALTNTPANNVGNKSASPNPNGLRNPSPIHKAPEKRTHSRMQANSSSVTVDLTDDEPPTKISNKSSPSQPVRVVPPQNLLAQQRQFPPINNARKVYIPISGPQAQQLRPGQTIVMKNPPLRPGVRMPMARPQQSPVRPKQTLSRHPAPLPESMKQYTPPTWKALPPAPDLKLSKVENGIVISWKIDGYPEGGYETIASYQLYAYQETTAPPCTALWKKIGDVKALPLPMACTLTQFMAGFKYYFAVRAVDVRSRLGPFSLPGSILLLNKV